MKKNNKIHIYYLLLGIGIGLVFGSIINFTSPNVKYKEYTEEEIRQEARGLGMYELDEIFEMNDKFNQQSQKSLEDENRTAQNNAQNIESENKIDGKSETNESNTLDQNTDSKSQEYIEFSIQEGDSSGKVINNLYKANIIKDKEKFKKLVFGEKLERKLQYGLFKIPLGADYQTILSIIAK